MTSSIDRIYDYNKICDKIKQLDSKIKFAGVINKRGRLVAEGVKEGRTSIVEARHEETLYMELALRVRMRREFDRQLGKVNFAMSSRADALMMSFPTNYDIVYVVAEPDADYEKLPQQIIDIIQKVE